MHCHSRLAESTLNPKREKREGEKKERERARQRERKIGAERKKWRKKGIEGGREGKQLKTMICMQLANLFSFVHYHFIGFDVFRPSLGGKKHRQTVPALAHLAMDRAHHTTKKTLSDGSLTLSESQKHKI